MKFLALVSGGKDSCFNILHCLAQGHELVVLANLKPADSTTQEMDSFMFQTVGHDVLEYYSECVGVPMYRGLIKGTSKNQELNYKLTNDDEIEDLYSLIKSIIDKHPDIEGVSVGAILSAYQRTRVENVCQRLGLTSLAYLWQRNQLELMTEMVNSEMEAILIKVAAVGLNENHLQLNLKEMFPKLLNLNSKFDLHICGEGGEFETLVLDAPFFKKKLKVIETKQNVSNDGVAYIEPLVKAEEKYEYVDVKDRSIDWKKFITLRNDLLNDHFSDIQSIVVPEKASQINAQDIQFFQDPSILVKLLGNKLFISNIRSKDLGVEQQAKKVFEILQELLEAHQLTTSHIQHSTLLIESMSNFSIINSVYVSFFHEPLPPSRVCVQTSLPKGSMLQLSVVAMLDISYKSGLHVQGRSYWAPANIGPYSQSIVDEDLVASLSGQIPLVPASMELSRESTFFNSILSLQHFDNVKNVTGCTNQLSAVAFIKDSSDVLNTSRIWKSYSEKTEGNPRECLLIVQVQELPRGADIEWGGLSYKKIIDMYADDEDEEDFNFKDRALANQNSLFESNNGHQVSTLSLTKDEFNTFQFNSSYHYSIYCSPGTIKSSLSDISADYIPVLNVWNYKGEQTDFGIIVRASK
ncbi:hypothetical protein WICMUC_005888 [Wickerhamomyces mucosus]|uniref:Diphthine--ammonia ligase n=1 Tax=Wickerhamomyces mucosus TaxID=1378264 RepID=A0A9P8P1N9_9ASCO|nr:hypothetical protein WICMUC_005888 [Wickerhamomyces mucosus]